MNGRGAGKRDALACVDHLVFLAPRLEAGVRVIEESLGVRATPGGRHPEWGTHNALIGLGPRVYLEILAPDPEAPAPSGPRIFGLDHLAAPRLATWSAHACDLDSLVERAFRRGLDLGRAQPGSRRRHDGTLLSWKLTLREGLLLEGLVPFFIDWGDTAHPASTAIPGGTLVGLRAEHPDPPAVTAALGHLDLDLRVDPAPTAAVIATIRTARGDVEIR